VEKRVVYCMFLLVDFLFYAVGVGLTNDAYQYACFVLILLLLCLLTYSGCRLVMFH